MSEIKLCINVDHIATLRQARGEIYPDPVEGARVCEEAGAFGITVHLREDRRHIQDDDVIALRDVVVGKYNLEMALSDEIIDIALSVMPDQVTLVPEKREELTTEGGLDVKSQFEKISLAVKRFQKKNIITSLFIEPDEEAVKRSKDSGTDYIEFHTGTYCEMEEKAQQQSELIRIFKAAEVAGKLGLGINAGHGLNVWNLAPLLGCPGLEELNIGHSVVSRALFLGLPGAVKELLDIIDAQA